MTKNKAKRKLSDIDFSETGASISLVGPSVGGPANNRQTILMKASKNFSEETIRKAQEVKVTMPLPEFLERFFFMYCEDAQLLAQMFGYDPSQDLQEDLQEEKDEFAAEQDWIASKLQNFEVMKSVYEADSLSTALSELKEDEYLSLLKDQETIEKAWDKSKKASKKVKPKKETNKMSDSNDGGKPEVVEKSALVAIEKALATAQAENESFKVELQKALEDVKALRAEKQEAIYKSRKGSLVEVLKNAEQAETVFKAIKDAEDADFTAVVEVMKSLVGTLDKSDLFKSKGGSTASDEKPTESKVASILKKQYANK